jgi:hypothetical protein
MSIKVNNNGQAINTLVIQKKGNMLLSLVLIMPQVILKLIQVKSQKIEVIVKDLLQEIKIHKDKKDQKVTKKDNDHHHQEKARDLRATRC